MPPAPKAPTIPTFPKTAPQAKPKSTFHVEDLPDDRPQQPFVLPPNACGPGSPPPGTSSTVLLRGQHIQLNSISWSTSWDTVTVRSPSSGAQSGGALQVTGGTYSISCGNRLTVSVWDGTSNFATGPYTMRGRPACATLIPGDHQTLPPMTVNGVLTGGTYFVMFEIIPDVRPGQSTVPIGMVLNVWFDVTGWF
jgi:hypothetical protein